MKKNVEIINIDNSLAKWMIDKLEKAPVSLMGAEEFKESLINLVDGISCDIMLEYGDGADDIFSGKQIRCGELTIYVNARRVTRGQEEIILTPKEFDILYFLAKNRGTVFTKEQIYQAVWNEQYLLDDSNIMAFIRKLRKKIEINPDDPEYIITIWGIGYKFNDRI